MLGLLQRGRGQGFLRALNGEPHARSLLTKCIIEDPRTDRQVEDRETYYAELAIALDLDLAELERHLFSPDDVDIPDVYRTGLTLSVLAEMARRGRQETVALLRRYVATGWNWSWAIYALATIDPSALRGLAVALVSRFGEEDLVEETGYEGGPAWDLLRSEHERLARAHRTAEARRPVRLDPQEAAAPSESFLSQKNGWTVLRHRITDADRELLRRAVRDTSSSIIVRRNAMIALGYQGDTSVIDAADDMLADIDDTFDEPLANAAWRYFMQLLRHGPVIHLRRWIDRPGARRSLAAHMLGDWGTPEDAATMRSLLAGFWDEREIYSVASLVEGLSRIGDMASARLLRVIFEETDYSYLRPRAAVGLSRTDPDFPNGLGVECLWDCEHMARVVGCQFAALGQPLVQDRLRALITATAEDDKVREAARGRLAVA